jgi:hypothetical protein
MTAASGAWSQTECDPGNHQPCGRPRISHTPETYQVAARERGCPDPCLHVQAKEALLGFCAQMLEARHPGFCPWRQQRLDPARWLEDTNG